VLVKEDSEVLTKEGKLAQSGYSKFQNVHWDSQPLASSYKALRYKKWDFYGVFAENVTLCMAVADLYFAGNVFVTVFEKGKTPFTVEKLVLPWEELQLSPLSESGLTLYNSTHFSLSFNSTNKHSKRIRVHKNEEFNIDLVFEKSPNQEGMVLLSPMSQDMSQFFFTHKQFNYQVEGTAHIKNKKFVLQGEKGMMDWGRGVWPYFSTWIWGSGMRGEVALNLGEHLHSPNVTNATDDHILIGEKLIKLGAMHVSKPGVLKDPWEFKTFNSKSTAEYAAANITFYPEEFFFKTVNFWLVQSDMKQIFGEYVGQVAFQGNIHNIRVRGLLEVHEARW